jgi:hypothetical protein
MAVLLTAGVASANTVWTATDPNARAAGYSDWSIAANWSLGIPGVTDQKPVFNSNSGGNTVECRVTNNTLPFSNNLVMGDGSPAGILRVMNGGTITQTGPWCGLGYNADGGTMIVEEGGTFVMNDHLWFGMNPGGIGRLVMDGGYVRTPNAMDLGRGTNPGGLGFVTINSGILRLRYYPDNNDNVGSLCDIRFGALVIDNNYVTRPSPLWSRIDAGTLVGFGGEGELVITRETFDGATRTFVRAIHPMVPSPAYGSTVLVPVGPTAPVNLSWTNMDPNLPGDPVYVDVWFGTDPNKLNPLVYQQKLTKSLLTTVQVNAPAVGGITKYYWQVDSYIYGSPTGTPIIGDVFEFSANDDTPPTVVIDTPDTVTWANKPVQLNATVTDAGTSAVTYAWTSNPAGVVFTPSAAVEDPVATANPATFPVNYTLTCSVKDGFNPTVTNTDTMVLEVYADACAAARDGANLGLTHQADLVAPFCKIDLADLAVIALDWTTDYTILVPTPIP